LGCRVDYPGFESQLGEEVYLLSQTSRPALGPTQPAIYWVLGAPSLGVKRPEREANNFHLAPMLRMSAAIPPLPLYVFVAYTGIILPLLYYILLLFLLLYELVLMLLLISVRVSRQTNRCSFNHRLPTCIQLFVTVLTRASHCVLSCAS
jgi:hypothetical protein